jgi:SAM-dependent methyltransferase
MTAVGVDVEAAMVSAASSRASARGVDASRASWVVGNAERLPFEDGVFDVVASRHAIHILSREGRARFLQEALRVLRPGGRLHVVAEDYSMVEFSSARPEEEDLVERLWWATRTFGRNAGGDWVVGHKLLAELRRALPADAVRWDDPTLATGTGEQLVVWDSWLHGPLLARIWKLWRDGYTDIIADTGLISREDCKRAWDAMCDAADAPPAHGRLVWRLPLVFATKAR